MTRSNNVSVYPAQRTTVSMDEYDCAADLLETAAFYLRHYRDETGEECAAWRIADAIRILKISAQVASHKPMLKMPVGK
ncbi:MAG: hypothetical protein HWE33_12945 [Rhodobacteraceae bacterium]|nr:hypothetical protein [Paracoccaceae bacterium]